MNQPFVNANRDLKTHGIPGVENIIGFLIALLAIGYLVGVLYRIPFIEMSNSLFGFLVILLTIPITHGTTKKIFVVLLLFGIIMMIQLQVPLKDWMYAVNSNLTLVSLFVFAPMLGIPILTGHYMNALQLLMEKKLNNPKFFFLSSKLLTHTLAIILNIGSVTMVYHLSSASSIRSKRLIANAIIRGFGTSIYWSPYFSSMAIILSYMPISWASIAIFAMGFAILSFAISIWVDWPLIRQTEKELSLYARDLKQNIDSGQLKKAKWKVAELFSLLGLMMSLVLVIEFITSYPMVFIICLISILFPMIWCILTKSWPNYIKHIKHHVYFTLPGMKKEIALFLVAGFFSSAISNTDFSSVLIQSLQDVFGTFRMGIAFCISILIVLLASVGVHPLVVVTILATNIKPELLGFSPEYFSLLMLASWGLSIPLAPTSAVNNLLAQLLEVDIKEISIGWNLKYVFILLFILPVYLTLLQ